jgi:HK97 family phage major capsid protein
MERIMENKNITLSSQELKEIFKKSMQPFTDIVSEMKAVAEKSAGELVGEDAKEKLLRENADYRFSSLLCAVKKQDEETIRKIEAIEKAADPMNEATPGDGGYLVPALTEQSMRELIPTVGQAFKYCQVMPLSTGNPINLPKESTLPTAYWVAENAAITESQPEIGVDTLSPKKVVCLATVTNELLLDAKPAIGAYVTKKMAQVIGAAIDTKVFQNGNTTFTGLFYASNTFGNTELTSGTNPNTLTYQDIINCFTGVDMNYVANGAWHMSRSVYALVLGLVDSQNRPLIQPTFENPLGSIFGYPVRIIEKAPDSSVAASKPIILFGDLSNSVVGDITGVRFDLFDSGTVGGTSLIENDLTGIRAVKRVGFTPGLTSAYSVIKTAAS